MALFHLEEGAVAVSLQRSRDKLTLTDWDWLSQGHHDVSKSWPAALRAGEAVRLAPGGAWPHRRIMAPGAIVAIHGRDRIVSLSEFIDLVETTWPEALTVPYVRRSVGYEISKRAVDVCGSVIGLILLAPVFFAIALLIKLDDGGPVIYRREIVGLQGRRIHAYKFRTMIPNADWYLLSHPELMRDYVANMKLHCDPRITHLGTLLRRSSLDELPQLVNVLRGEMSLVGPRMIHPSEAPRYGLFAEVRQSVRPGITGLWQVSGRQNVDYTDRIRLDRRYLRQRSFWLDLRILARTVIVLIRRQGAY